jgi:peroxiredoxin
LLTRTRHLEEWGTWAPSDGELVDGLLGLPVPSLRLPSTAGGEADLAELSRQPLVLYVHPGTETKPELREDPDGLLGTGCTVQSRVFEDYEPDFARRAVRIVGLSARSREDQRKLIFRARLTFGMLSDQALALADALGLPTYTAATGERVYQRLAFFAREGVIEKVFYPVPIPRRNAIDILSWMAKQGPDL